MRQRRAEQGGLEVWGLVGLTKPGVVLGHARETCHGAMPSPSAASQGWHARGLA